MDMQIGFVDPLVKPMPHGELPEGEGRLDAARGEYEAIQLAIRSAGEPLPVGVSCTPFVGENGQIIPGVRVRLVGRVPVKRGTHRTPPDEAVAPAPGEFPDPLLETAATVIPPNRTESFWVDVWVPLDAQPGDYRATATLRVGQAAGQRSLLLRVHPASVPVERNLRLTNWFGVNPKWLGYENAPAFSVNWWRTFDAIVHSMWDHRQNYFWTSLDAWMIPRVVGPDGQLAFDFANFDRWVEAFSHPDFVTYIEGQPITTRQGYDGHIQAPVWRVEDGKVVREVVEADSPEAREWYWAFLTALRDHLKAKGWLERFRLHIGDEPHGHQLEPYATVAGYVREFAPEFQIMEALDVRDDFEFFKRNVDVWVPQLGRFDQSVDLMAERMQEGKEVWHYTCLFPNGAYPNRFIDYPLIKTQLLHWVNFKWGYDGYLHWGWNHWRDPGPFEDTEPPHGGGTFLPPGDAWIVYPGEGTILDSMRHEAMRDGVEDYELLIQLRERDPEKAQAIADTVIRSFTDYERDVARFRAARRELLESLREG